VDELLIRALMLYAETMYTGAHCSNRVVLVCVSTYYYHIADRVVNAWWCNVSRHGMLLLLLHRLNWKTWACCVSNWPPNFYSTVTSTPRRHSGRISYFNACLHSTPCTSVLLNMHL